MACTAMITGIKLVASSKKDIGVDRGEQGQSALERENDDRHPLPCLACSACPGTSRAEEKGRRCEPCFQLRLSARDLVCVGPGTGWRRPLPLRDRMAPPHGRRDARDGFPGPRISPTPTSILRRDNALPLVLNFRSFNFLQKYVCKHNLSYFEMIFYKNI